MRKIASLGDTYILSFSRFKKKKKKKRPRALLGVCQMWRVFLLRGLLNHLPEGFLKWLC